MNHKNLALLRDTLLALPADINFDMDTGYHRGICGTAACIAGVCYALQPKPEAHPGWPTVRHTALKWLGLPVSERNFGIGHDLFDYDLAPKNCTPQQAAIAVQNVMEGRAPW